MVILPLKSQYFKAPVLEVAEELPILRLLI